MRFSCIWWTQRRKKIVVVFSVSVLVQAKGLRTATLQKASASIAVAQFLSSEVELGEWSTSSWTCSLRERLLKFKHGPSFAGVHEKVGEVLQGHSTSPRTFGSVACF